MSQDTSLRLPATLAAAAIQSLLWPMSIAAVVVGLLVWIAVVATYNFHRERESARLEALSELRATQVADWLAEKSSQVRFAGASPLGEQYKSWREDGDLAARDKMLGRLPSFRKASGGHDVLVVDDQGAVLAADPPQALESSAPLKAAVRRATDTHEPQSTSFYGESGPQPAPRIDVVSPLYLSGSPPRGLVVLRIDPREFLLPLLTRWPVPSQTALALLVRRDGDFIVGPYGRTRAALSEPELLAAKALRGEVPFGAAVEALDFRGQRVLGVVRPVKGTDLFLVAKIDRGEVYADAQRDAAWIGAAGLLALLACGALSHGWRGRKALALTRAAGARQEADRQRLEELVTQRTRELAAKNQSLERTVADLEAFSESVSHDLRGPLRTVNGFAVLLERTEGAQLSEDGRRKLSRITAGALTMDRMIEDILRCSRAERLEMQFEQVDLNPLVREVVAELAAEYPRSLIDLDPLPVVRADPAMARQVFANLIGNALKFSARAEAPRVHIGVSDEVAGPRIFVRDNGVGFDEAQSDKLFAPFQRLHTGEEFPGTGVGLSIVRRLVERHGGTITAQSEPAVRTQFTFDFPG
jgi:signal transduction histidine kinase